MADRARQPEERRAEAALRDLGAHLAYPPTPDLARQVRARLAAPPRRARWAGLLARPTPRRLALALVLLLALAGAVLLLSPAAREAIAGRLGVPGITITYLTPTPIPPAATATSAAMATATAVVAGTSSPSLATATPVATPPTATPTIVALRPTLGERVTLAEARARVAFPVVVPSLADLGPPDEVYVGSQPVGGQVTFLWRARPGLPPVAGTDVGLLLTQFRGDPAISFGQKGLSGGTRVETLLVGGERGVWVEGDLHQFSYLDAGGQYRTETVRLAGHVLLWERQGLTLRLEGAPTRDEALRIAASLR